jgi:hypothetical protein
LVLIMCASVRLIFCVLALTRLANISHLWCLLLLLVEPSHVAAVLLSCDFEGRLVSQPHCALLVSHATPSNRALLLTTLVEAK